MKYPMNVTWTWNDTQATDVYNIGKDGKIVYSHTQKPGSITNVDTTNPSTYTIWNSTTTGSY